MDLAAMDVRLSNGRDRLPDALPDVYADLPDARHGHRAIHPALNDPNKSGSPSHYGKGDRIKKVAAVPLLFLALIAIRESPLRLRARPTRYRLMPSRDVLLILLDPDSSRAPEIDSNQRGDIRNRVARSRNKLAIRQHRVEPFQSLDRRIFANLAVFLDLRDAALEKVAGVAERSRRHRQNLEPPPPVPHLDDGFVLRVDAHQLRLGLDVLEIAANRDRLRDMRAVVEFEHR